MSVALHTVSVAASGSTDQPIESLMALQSAVAGGVDLVIPAGRIRLSLSAYGWPRLQLRRFAHGPIPQRKYQVSGRMSEGAGAAFVQ